MKLKIDYIQDIIDNYDLEKRWEDRICHKIDGKYLRIHIEDKSLFESQNISDNILPYFTNLIEKEFRIDQIFKTFNYKDLTAKCGFVLGVPFYLFSEPSLKDLDGFVRRRIENKMSEIYSSENDIVIKKRLENLDFERERAIKHYANSYVSLVRETTHYKLLRENRKEELEKEYNDWIDEIKIKKENIVLHSMHTNIETIKQEGCAAYRNLCEKFNEDVKRKVENAHNYRDGYLTNTPNGVVDYLSFILKDSFYPFEFDCSPTIEYQKNTGLLLVEYCLPNKEQMPNIKCVKKFQTKSDELRYCSNAELNRLFDEIIYRITIRSIAELLYFDTEKLINTISFNGLVSDRNKATGKLETKCILSVQTTREQFKEVDLSYIDAKACFKHLKGVSGSRLYGLAAVAPIMQINKQDKRFVESQSVSVDSGVNLASMDWEEFEHLVRELFEKEFSCNGGEVKVTQSSRDGGVDAIAFDPDPIRGGKIVIQAKRYTNTVGVSAVRDLYGTVMNEGANKGILVTTSDYGADSYEFAKGKPLTLLNGGHILYLLEKHGQRARIDIAEAKELMKNL